MVKGNGHGRKCAPQQSYSLAQKNKIPVHLYSLERLDVKSHRLATQEDTAVAMKGPLKAHGFCKGF